jgi:hypothetical protein
MTTTFASFISEERLTVDVLTATKFVCIPIYCPDNRWWFTHQSPRSIHAANPIIAPFEGIMHRLSGVGTWFRELEFDGVNSVATTTSRGDVEAEGHRTPAGSWLWIDAQSQALCYSNDACDAHVLCLSPETLARLDLESLAITSLKATVAAISQMPIAFERRWHAMFFLHHIRLSVQLSGMNAAGFLGNLAV